MKPDTLHRIGDFIVVALLMLSALGPVLYYFGRALVQP